MRALDAETSRRIGLAAYSRVLAQHTYAHRAAEVDRILQGSRVRVTPRKGAEVPA